MFPCPVLSDGTELCKCDDAPQGVDCSFDEDGAPTGCTMIGDYCSVSTRACANRCYDLNLRSRYNLLAPQCLSFDVASASSECAQYSQLDSDITVVGPPWTGLEDWTFQRYTICHSTHYGPHS